MHLRHPGKTKVIRMLGRVMKTRVLSRSISIRPKAQGSTCTKRLSSKKSMYLKANSEKSIEVSAEYK
jgi:hypothetical protein